MDSAAHPDLRALTQRSTMPQRSVERVEGVVVRGHGVASGTGATSPFAAGTIDLQAPHLAARGVDLSAYHHATINLDIDPFALRLVVPRWTLEGVEWTDVHEAETFSFVECTLTHRGRTVDALVYHPHPETKPMHHQPGTVVELLAPLLPGLGYGDVLTFAPAVGQGELRRQE